MPETASSAFAGSLLKLIVPRMPFCQSPLSLPTRTSVPILKSCDPLCHVRS